MTMIEEHEAEIQQRIDEKIAAGEQAAMDSLDADMALADFEHFEYQQLQSQAHAAGILPTADAQIIYLALNGEMMNSRNGGWADGVPTARKVTITKLMLELVQLKLAGRFSGVDAQPGVAL